MSQENEFKPGCDWLVLLGGCSEIAKPAVLGRRPLSTEEMQAMERAGVAAGNLLMSINFGISAIGGLIASAAHNPEMAFTERTVADAGWLLEELGRVSQHLASIETESEYYRNAANWHWVSEESEVDLEKVTDVWRRKCGRTNAPVAPPAKKEGRS